MQWVETSTTVRFNEVDQWSIAWYGSYFAWFELGRLKTLERFSLLPKDFTAMGVIAPVVSARCDYKKPALTNEEIIIRTRLEKPRTASLIFQFEILNGSDRSVLARGETTQVLTRLDGVMLYAITGELKERIEAMARYFEE